DGLVAPQLTYAQASGTAATSDASTPAAAPTQAPAAAEPAPPPAPATTEAVENPYGLGARWKNGDFVARFVLILLVIMSMGSWYIMITKFVEQLRANRRAKLADAQLWSAPSLAEGAK
ncbi:MotA/TolQ/ExbB proton channel family protein, partial [Burkholderia cenocepacia]|nr:MotA/TolQ/ExbB proton channel family protein [Burkholderia cenocepacia]